MFQGGLSWGVTDGVMRCDVDGGKSVDIGIDAHMHTHDPYLPHHTHRWCGAPSVKSTGTFTLPSTPSPSANAAATPPLATMPP